MLVSLRNYSNYSICESNIKIEDLVNFASKNNFNAIALTDYKLLSGSLEFSTKCQKAGIQPIIGLDVDYVSILDHSKRVTFLSKSEEGFKNINILSTEVNTNNNFLLNSNNIKDYANGNILILGGLYSYFEDISINQKNLNKVLNEIKNLKVIFKNDLFFEYDPKLNNILLKEVSKKLEIPLFKSFFSFYKSTNDFDAMQILHCVKNGEYLQNSTFKINNNYSLDKSVDSSDSSLILNSQLIAQKINFLIKEKPISLPNFSKGLASDEDTEIIKQSRSGLDLRLKKLFKNLSIEDFNKKSKIYRDRLEYELNVIIKMKFSGYFLIVSDFIRWAKSQSIPVGPGRGSGAGSIVAWSLLITDVDPIQYGLLFERFLNPDRVSMPDFDIDFCESRRDEVIEYVQKKYGYQNVAQIITFGTMKSRSILKDIGRVEGIPYSEVDRMVNKIPYNPVHPLTISELKANHSDQLGDLAESEMLNKAESMEGALRNASTHAAGIIISSENLYGNVPLFKNDDSEIMATQYNMKDCEKAGLLKFDFLGLANLTIIDETLKLIKQNHNIEIDLNEISFNDQKTFELLGKGLTCGVFQVESAAMVDTLVKLQPTNLEEVIAVLALNRPGPMQFIDSFIKRKKGEEKIIYDHPLLEPILNETYGIIVYQEQIMKIAQVISGYSLGEADLLRRAIGKKIKSELLSQKENFVKGAGNKKIKSSDASKLFSLIEKFAEYGFNKSHAAAYAFITYYTAYLKAHYPEEFYCELLNNSINNTDKIFIILSEISSQNIEVIPPDINISNSKFTVNENKIHYGLSALKGVGEESMIELVSNRKEKGAYKSLVDFNKRLSRSVLNKRQIEKLILSNSFKSIHKDISKLFSNVETIIQKKDENSLFSDEDDSQFFLNKKIIKIDQINAEFESYGFLYSQKKQTSLLSKLNLNSFKEKIDSKSEIFEDFYFYVIKSQYKTTKNGKRYILLNVINESGYFDLRLFDDKFDMKSLQANFIKTKIKSSIKNDFYNVNIEKIEILKDDGLINQISYLSFQDLLDFDKNDSLNEVKINKTDKILTISLN
jgi:DNA polymerase-3 subunit alpha